MHYLAPPSRGRKVAVVLHLLGVTEAVREEEHTVQKRNTTTTLLSCRPSSREVVRTEAGIRADDHR